MTGRFEARGARQTRHLLWKRMWMPSDGATSQLMQTHLLRIIRLEICLWLVVSIVRHHWQ